MGRARKKGKAITGWLVLDKPLEMSSTAALGKARWLLGARKAGHAGTLDPLASGVLPIAFGEATKTIALMMAAQKVYRFTVRWGVSTQTLDAEGAVLARSAMRPERAAIEAALPRFVGVIEQVPPAFSAIKVDGQRAYALAREGQAVALQPRRVRIDALRLLAQPDAEHATFEVTCGKGTYVRALARDLAKALGAEGHVSALRRTRVGPFGEKQAIGLGALEEMVHKARALEVLMPLAAVLDDIPALAVSAADAQRIRHGQAIALPPQQAQALATQALPDRPAVHAEQMVYVHCGQQPVAICKQNGVRLNVVRVFNDENGVS